MVSAGSELSVMVVKERRSEKSDSASGSWSSSMPRAIRPASTRLPASRPR